MFGVSVGDSGPLHVGCPEWQQYQHLLDGGLVCDGNPVDADEVGQQHRQGGLKAVSNRWPSSAAAGVRPDQFVAASVPLRGNNDGAKQLKSAMSAHWLLAE
jgi:hypothetical protein